MPVAMRLAKAEDAFLQSSNRTKVTMPKGRDVDRGVAVMFGLLYILSYMLLWWLLIGTLVTPSRGNDLLLK